MMAYFQNAVGADATPLMVKLAESADFFVYAFVELAILFVGISFLVGVINEFVPAERVKSILSGKQGRGYLAGAGLGAITPFCSCSTIPLVVGLLKAQAGFGPTMTFLFASPLVNFIIVGLFFSLFGLKITAIYVVMALGLAVFTGWILNRFNFQRFINKDLFNSEMASSCGCNGSKPVPSCGRDEPEPIMAPMQMAPATACCGGGEQPMSNAGSATTVAEPPSRWMRIFRDATDQFVKLMPLVTIGLLIGAGLHGFVPSGWVAEFAGADNPLAVPFSAFIGVPLYVRASTILPIGLSLMGKGMSLGAVVALTIGGAGASIPEIVMLKGLFRWPILVAFLASVFGMAIVTGFVMNIVV